MICYRATIWRDNSDIAPLRATQQQILAYPPAADDLDRVCAAIAPHPDGLGIDRLLQALNGALSRRTLQRRLAALALQGQLVATGAGRATRYRLAPTPTPTPTPTVTTATSASDGEAQIPLSAEGAEIRTHIRQPRQARQPVGYRMDFLAAYQPNTSAYLPTALREQLHALGRSPAADAPAGTFARDILNRLLIDLSWASSRLEGNTYSRLDTQRLIEFGQAADGKDAIETQMVLNHKAAVEYLVHGVAGALSGGVGVHVDTVVSLHALLSDGLMADPRTSGRLRQRAVDISGSVFLPLALPQRIEELFGVVLGMAAEITDPFEQAFFLMVHLPYLQPFEDVNKRVSRLAANIPLMQHNLCPLSFIDVPVQAYVDGVLGVYELNRVDLLRDVFVWAYARSCQQYVAVRQQLVPPDALRLRYRRELSDLVAAIVRSGLPANGAAVQARLPATVAVAEQAAFVALVLTEFKSLHAGNVVRFGLRPLEFAAWQQAVGGQV